MSAPAPDPPPDGFDAMLADTEEVNRLTAEIAAVELRLDRLRADFAARVLGLEDRRRSLLASLSRAGQRIQDRAEAQGWGIQDLADARGWRDEGERRS